MIEYQYEWRKTRPKYILFFSDRIPNKILEYYMIE